MVLTKRTANLPLICQICGDTARGINFDVMTCMSCKAFFRRHAQQPTKYLQCPLDSSCEITQLTRSGCSACRLKKCFSLGMNPDLIRRPPTQHRQGRTNAALAMPAPLNLLQHDASTLTSAEWNLLSNILFAYDQINPIGHTQFMLQQQSALPPKLRIKSTATMEIIGYYYMTAQSFIERTPFFRELPVNMRQAAIEQSFAMAGAFNSLFLIREANAMDYPAYIVGTTEIYGAQNQSMLGGFVSRLEQNSVLVKIMLLLIGFSGHCSIISPESMKCMSPSAMTSSLRRSQDLFVTMMWKYLNYQYGSVGAVRCFSSFITFVLNILRWMELGSNSGQTQSAEPMGDELGQTCPVNN